MTTSSSKEKTQAASRPEAGTRLPALREKAEVPLPEHPKEILIVDDDRRHAETTAEALSAVGYKCDIATSGGSGLEHLKRKQYDLILTDLVMADISGIEILRQAQELNPFVAVMVLTGHGTIETAVEAMKQGAVDYIVKPLNIHALRIQVHKALEVQELRRINLSQKRQLGENFGFDGIIGKSEKIRRVMEICSQIARTDVAVLITGETGTGKELIAKAIHENSLRKDRHFVPMNCAALSSQLIEDELFGHEKGSFTGANFQRKGRFEHAHRGTLFLDEVGDIPPDVQVKLLRALENREIVRIGSNDPVKVDVRIISATHRNLEDLVKQNHFREDLYYRLKVVTIDLPPLRERREDIPLLIHHFIQKFSEAHRKPIEGITQEAVNYLAAHPWKGNVRELKHQIENMVVVAQGPTLGVDNLPENIFRRPEGKPGASGLNGLAGVTIREVERELIKNTLSQVSGNREAAAKTLGIGERTLYRKIKRYGLS